MKNYWIKLPSVALVLCLALPNTGAAAENYEIDASHTSVIFGISHLGFSYTYGRFNKVGGSYSLDREDPSASKFQLTIDAASVDTNDAKRDDHLRNADFFNVNQFPLITFESAGVELQENDEGEKVYQVTGKLTMHGVTREITIPLKLLGEGSGPGGVFRTGFLTETRLQRSEYGMTNMIPAIGDDVAITISFEGTKK